MHAPVKEQTAGKPLIYLSRLCCSHPFIYFPTFFLVKSVVEQQKDPVVYAFHKWQRDIWGSCKALWTIWVPAQLLNFALVPRYMRVPFGTMPLARLMTPGTAASHDIANGRHARHPINAAWLHASSVCTLCTDLCEHPA